MMNLPTFTDLLRARRTIVPYLRPTALYTYPSLSQLLGCEVWVKHENHNPTSSFKVRGGVNLIANLSAEEKARGVITASTGNHGQSVAFAANLFGVQAVVAVPNGANPAKVESIRNLGAEIRAVGKDFDDCRTYVEETAPREGLRYISSGDEPLLIAGVGTYALEILEYLPETEVVIVPVGGGSGASGVCLAVKTTDPLIQVIAVQSEAAPAAYLTWRERRRVEASMETMAEGLATRRTFDLPQAILQRDLDDFVLVSEAELKAATLLAMEKTRNLVEAAGAASLAAALKIRERLQGKRVVLIFSGGNITLPQLKTLLDEQIAMSGA